SSEKTIHFNNRSKGMNKKTQASSRRGFLRSMATVTAGLAVGNSVMAAEEKNVWVQSIRSRNGFSANDQINIALIGAGGMGVQDTITALQVPGVKLVAVCDLYDGRLKEAKERWGSQIHTTRSYKEILNRKDIDAVIIATPDHWHQQISV